MRRSERLVAKENAVVRAQTRALNIESARRKAEEREQAIQAQIKKNNETANQVRLYGFETASPDEKRFLSRKAPRLFRPDYERQLSTIERMKPSWLRPLTEWQPKGKSPETLYRGLCDHLFAKYKVPSFIWSGFSEFENTKLIIHIATGGSVYEAVKNGMLSVPLTRKMCHDLMQTPAEYNFVEAVRRVQVRSVGGSHQLFKAWCHKFDRFDTKASEEFTFTVLEWFGKNPMLAPDKIEVLLDYIRFRRARDTTFSMKGRSVLALLRETDQWHNDLAKSRRGDMTAKYLPCGIKEMIWDEPIGDGVTRTWTCEELLSAKMLADEGRALNHCVYSYSQFVSNGSVSIWSLQLDGTRALTIEVANQNRSIRQVRGKCNRKAMSEESRAVIRWASENNLTISNYVW